MKKEEGITLITLVVTVIVLIILAAVSINLVLGENGILTMAKKAKENTELAQIKEQEELNVLYEYLEQEGGTEGDISYDAIVKLNDFKKKIADYIEEAGGIKPEYTANAETFGERIKGIVKEVTKDATATAEDITNGKTAWVNGNKITGTKNNSSSMLNFSIYTYAIPNATNGLHQYPIKNMNITNYATLNITGSLDGDSSGYMEVIIDDEVKSKIEIKENNINLSYNISANTKLTIHVFGSYTRTTVADLDIKLSI